MDIHMVRAIALGKAMQIDQDKGLDLCEIGLLDLAGLIEDYILNGNDEGKEASADS